MPTATVIHGDCLDVMPTLEAESFDSICTDPPYHLLSMSRNGSRRINVGKAGNPFAAGARAGGFMGAAWDGSREIAFDSEVWRRAMRLLKPGGYLLAFGGTRTFHRLTCAIEDAGFEIKDSLADFSASSDAARAFMESLSEEQLALFQRAVPADSALAWLYATGFPKSLNVSAAIDRELGQEPKRVMVACGNCNGTGWIGDPPSDDEINQDQGLVTPIPASSRTTGERCPVCNPPGTLPMDWGKVPARRTDGRYAYGFSEDAKRALGPVVSASDPTGFSGEIGLITEPATPEAAAWAGWGSALKPAWEPIVVARKPLSERNIARNVMRHGTGAINIDGCRIEGAKPVVTAIDSTQRNNPILHTRSGTNTGEISTEGRWPANVLLSHSSLCNEVGMKNVGSDGHYPARRPQGQTLKGHHGQDDLPERFTKSEMVGDWNCVEDCPIRMIDEQSGDLTSGAMKHEVPAYEGSSVTGFLRGRSGPSNQIGDSGGASRFFSNFECAPDCPVRMLDEQSGELASGDNNVIRESAKGYQANAYGPESRPAGTPMIAYGDSGGASRFFYTSKASRRERDERVRGEEQPLRWSSGEQNPGSFQSPNTHRAARNFHPTTKPVSLMRWLARLVTPPRGRVLDPFAGSGTTLVAALEEGFEAVGIELMEEYVRIAQQRIDGVQMGLF